MQKMLCGIRYVDCDGLPPGGNTQTVPQVNATRLLIERFVLRCVRGLSVSPQPAY